MKIITIGDSHTAGYPDYDPQTKGDIRSSYQYWLQTMLETKYSRKYEILNFGLLGDTSEGILERIKKILHNIDVDEVELFMINGGGNDWGINPIDYSNTLTNLLSAYKLIKNNNLQVILSSISPFGNEEIVQQLKDISNELKTLITQVSDNRIFFFDWFSLLYDNNTKKIRQEFNSGDYEHLNIDGYRYVGETIANYIVQNLILS